MSDPPFPGVFFQKPQESMNTGELLRIFVHDRSNGAFRRLVDAHIDLVYSAARRQVRDSALADDVTQTVFVTLAKNASRVSPNVPLEAWLLKVTQNIARNALRSRQRRHYHEQEAAAMHNFIEQAPPASPWSDVADHLDDVLAELRPTDRNLIVLRFMRNLPIKDAGLAVGMKENTASKRISRALEKLRKHFARRGIFVPSLALATLLSQHAVGRAPQTLAASVSEFALTHVAPLHPVSFLYRLLTPAKALAGAAVIGITMLAVLLFSALDNHPSPAASSTAVAADTTVPSDQAPAPPPLPALEDLNYDTKLPAATYCADRARTVFPAGLFPDVDPAGHPRGWADVSAFGNGKATLLNGDVKAIGMTNDDPSQNVAVRAVLPLRRDWKTLAVASRVFRHNVTGQRAGVGFAFLDDTGDQVSQGVFLSFVTRSFNNARPLMATLAVPRRATALMISVEMFHATGDLVASDILVMPVDPARDPDPARVVALHRAIRDGDAQKVADLVQQDRRLLESHNMDFNGGTPVVGAAWQDQADVIQTLAGLGADLDAPSLDAGSFSSKAGQTATEWACWYGSSHALAVLMKLTNDDPVPLIQAVQIGRQAHQNSLPSMRNVQPDYDACQRILTQSAATRPSAQPTTQP
jgi:RNA polymerase sigma factor (sigma-70 family)